MQTCTRCNTQTTDSALTCPGCGADLHQTSTAAVALKRFLENPRVRLVRVSVAADACPVCSELQGAYPKDRVPPLPHLPVEGCSNGYGCRCFYEPILDEVYP